MRRRDFGLAPNTDVRRPKQGKENTVPQRSKGYCGGETYSFKGERGQSLNLWKWTTSVFRTPRPKPTGVTVDVLGKGLGV